MRKAAFIFTMALSLLSCSENTEIISYGKVSDKIIFSIDKTRIESHFREATPTRGMQDGPAKGMWLRSASGDSLLMSVTESPWTGTEPTATRGTLAAKGSIAEFGVSASAYSKDASYETAGYGSYFCGIRAVPNEPVKYFWPTDDYHLSFFAYWPYDNENFVIESVPDDLGSPVYSYTVPQAISQHVDVMTANVTDCPGGAQEPVSLTFSHRLSALRMTFTNEGVSPVRILYVSIEGVRYSGTLQGDTWTLDDAVNDSSRPFMLDDDIDVNPGETVNLTGTSEILMMMPQSLPEGAKVKVATSKDVYETDITGEWEANCLYDYVIRMDEGYTHYLIVTDPADIAYSGGTATYTVQSYKANVLGRSVAVPWTVQYSEDNGDTWTYVKPSWLTEFTSSGDGSVTPAAYDVTVSAQTVSVFSTAPSDVLQVADPVADCDLSMRNNDGSARASRTTANCYMVHAPGTYKLPLVYGNAIVNGSTNTTAFAPSGTNGDTFMTPFLNHAGNGITDPWLKNNGAAPDAAELLWQDTPMITAVGISGDYLTFTVGADGLRDGNAVIAAKKDGTVVWSWHIWVTTESYTTLSPVDTGSRTYNVAPVNLGWSSLDNVTVNGYADRTCLVKVTQTGTGGETAIITVRQPACVESVASTPGRGFNPYYQWGRKDPEIPAEGTNASGMVGVNHEVYDIGGEAVTGITHENSSATAALTIQNPTVHYASVGMGYRQNNLWDATQTARGTQYNATAKTIYDPCPPGFCVPTSGLLYFIKSGGMTSAWSESGWAGRQITSVTPQIFLPATAHRLDFNGAGLSSGGSGFYWSATCDNNSEAEQLFMNSGGFGYYSYTKGYGLSVRPVAEE